MRSVPVPGIIAFIAFIVFAIFAAATDASAFDLVRKVVFPKGRSAVIFKGRLPREYAVYHAYVVRAKRGQRLSVKLNTADPDASFSIYETKHLGPNEDTLVLQDRAIREHTVIVPITSEYSIQVYGLKDIDDRPSGAAYSIQVTLL